MPCPASVLERGGVGQRSTTAQNEAGLSVCCRSSAVGAPSGATPRCLEPGPAGAPPRRAPPRCILVREPAAHVPPLAAPSATTLLAAC